MLFYLNLKQVSILINKDSDTLRSKMLLQVPKFWSPLFELENTRKLSHGCELMSEVGLTSEHQYGSSYRMYKMVIPSD